MEPLQILIGKGLPQIKFGMTKSQVTKILGNPDEKEVYQYSEQETDLTDAWHYDELGFSITFDEENDWLLGSIAVSMTPCLLDAQDVMDLSKMQLVQHLENIAIGKVEFDMDLDEETGLEMEVIFASDKNICFFLENDRVTEIKWSPIWADVESLDWPEDMGESN